MNARHQLFVDAYLGSARLNAAEAARVAGYATPKSDGYRLKREPEILAVIEARLKASALASDEVLSLLSDQARGTIEHFVRQTEDGEIFTDLTSDVAKQHFHLIKKAKFKKRTGGKPEDPWEETEVEIEIHDPQAAAVHIGRHYAMFTDKTDNKVSVEGVIGYDITPPASRSGEDNAGT